MSAASISVLLLRVLLAGLFVWSAAGKLHRVAPAPAGGAAGDPGAMTVYDRWVRVGTPAHYAFVGMEVLLAAWLLSGVWPRSAAAAAILVLGVYTAVLVGELDQVKPLPCGCFFVTPDAQDPGAVRRQLILGIVRNATLAVACAWLWAVGGRWAGGKADGEVAAGT